MTQLCKQTIGGGGKFLLSSLAMKALLLIALVAGVAPLANAAVCTNASAFGSAAINPGGLLVSISTCSFAGEYSTITGAVSGQTLRFTSAGTAGNITIHSGTFNGPVIASSGTSPLTFVNTFTGTLFAHWNLTNSCGTDSSCHATTVQCTSCAPLPPPVNDTCAGATTIACGSTTTGTTVGAGIDTGFTFCGTSGGTAPGVWYQFTATNTLTTASLCGSSYDTKIHVYDATAPANCATPASLPCVAGNDDSCGLQSSVTFVTVVGRTYKILVHGFSTGAGAFTLNLTCVPPPPGPCINTIAFGSANIVNTGCPTQAPTTISTCSFAGEYSTITGAVAGQNLTFTDSALGDQITLRCNAPGGPVIGVPGFGPSPLTVANTCTGTIFAHWNTPSCGSQSTCRTTTVAWNNRPILCTGVTIDGTIQSPIDQECDQPIPALPVLVANSNLGCPSLATLVLNVNTTPGSCPQESTITRTWTASNVCGQSAPPRTQVITIHDDTAPVINGVPANSTVDCPTPVPGRPPVTAVDNCAGSSNSPFAPGPGGLFAPTHDVTGTVAKINPAKLAQVNATAPHPNIITIQCQNPNNVCGPAGCATEYTAPAGQNFGNPDNWNYHSAGCTPGASVTVRVNRTDIDMDPAMSICSGDLCGTSNAGWSFGVCPAGSTLLGTGDDNIVEACTGNGPFSDPQVTFICPASGLFTMGVFDFLGTIGGEPWDYNLSGSSCQAPAPLCAPTITFNEQTIPGSCVDNYTVVRTWTATDCCQNTSPPSTQTVVHQDITDPILVDVPADITIECSEAIPAPANVTATDECSPVQDITVTLDEVNGQDPDPSVCGHYNYTITRTWTAVDRCGNDISATQTITVQDTTAPTLTGGVLAPEPPQEASSVCSPPSSGGFKVVCSTISDNCDASPSTTTEVVVTNYDVVDFACVERIETFSVACDEVIEIRLAAAPCPASSMAAPVQAQSSSSGLQIFTGVSVVLHETGTDACGNVGDATFDPTSSAGGCALLAGPLADATCPVDVCPGAALAHPAQGFNGTPTDRGRQSDTASDSSRSRR